nr:hypothetical protein [bacterium]
MYSRSMSIPCPVFDDTPTNGVSPHQSSGVNQHFAISDLISSRLCHGLSIFVTAIMIGTQADLAWLIDSIV